MSIKKRKEERERERERERQNSLTRSGTGSTVRGGSGIHSEGIRFSDVDFRARFAGTSARVRP